MIKFVKKVLILLLILAVCVISVMLFHCFVIGSQYKYNYQASLIEKVERLESIDKPKIILVGHSNLSFGINSEMIEEAIGMQVVNLGLHGGLGNAYHEEIAKQNIKAGDIVVVCHSTYADNDDLGDASLAWITFDWNFSLFPIFRVKDYSAMLFAYPNYLRSCILLWCYNQGNQAGDSCYSRSAFNQYGDVVYKPIKGQMEVDAFFKTNAISIPSINDTCINRLNRLNTYCNQRGATLLVAGYPVAYGKYANFSASDFINFENELSEKLDCEVISNYTDYFYPYEYFYNTTLHLTTEGANIRTKQLIDDIIEWKLMDSQKNSKE